MLSRLEWFHGQGFLHLDLKPSNFARAAASSIIYLLDYGLCRRIEKEEECAKKGHEEAKERTGVVGTIKYASLNAMQGGALGRRDDLISLGYMLLEWVKGFLPWKGTMQDISQILELKKEKKELYKDVPEEFIRYLEEVEGLGRGEKPRYEEYKEWFKGLFYKEGYMYDLKFDWSC